MIIVHHERTARHGLPDGPWQGALRLIDWGVIRADGEDAATFLQSQLTQDFAAFHDGEHRLAGYCSPKGRLLASFIAWRAGPQRFHLACSADLLAATLKRLSMFVLRAKCRLTDASGDVALWGLAGAPALAWLDGAAAAPGSVTPRGDAGQVLRLADVQGVPRVLLAQPAVADPPPLPLLLAAAWSWLQVHGGLPVITAATADQFVPQMVNLELLGGVNFRKGCYPGQEVVARSQYRGTLKRRMVLFEAGPVTALPGEEVFHSGDPAQPSGLVVNAAPHPDGKRLALLVSLKTAALGQGSWHLRSPDGEPLVEAALPYALPAPGDDVP
ncbi:folate-binding protein [Aquabacterium sp. J223]|nr:folate-binding protein [Aquabacterium sp. J223]